MSPLVPQGPPQREKDYRLNTQDQSGPDTPNIMESMSDTFDKGRATVRLGLPAFHQSVLKRQYFDVRRGWDEEKGVRRIE